MSRARRALALCAAATLVTIAFGSPAAALTLKFPRFEVPPRSDRELCTLVRLPRKKPMEFGGSLIVNLGGNDHFTSYHFLMWTYTGTDIAIFGVVANGFIRVPPGETRTETWGWKPGGTSFNVAGLGGGAVPEGPACVIMVTAHMHKRGKLFTVTYDGAGSDEMIYSSQ